MMVDLIKRVIEEDIDLQDSSCALWELKKSTPEIRQIYGHFLPPSHRKFVKGMVAKDFNFPPAYHNAPSRNVSDEPYEIGKEEMELNTIISLSDSIKIRAENEGAIVYTPYFNGFYINESAYQIIKCCATKVKVKYIISTIGIHRETVFNFLARVLTLGIVSVYPS